MKNKKYKYLNFTIPILILGIFIMFFSSLSSGRFTPCQLIFWPFISLADRNKHLHRVFCNNAYPEVPVALVLSVD